MRWDGDPSERPIDIEDREHERWAQEVGYRQLCEILYWCWDPIGLATSSYPWNEGEYNMYSLDLIAQLRAGLDAPGVTRFLRDLELNSIGCPGSGATPEVGEQIRLWYRSSIQVWLEFGPREPYRLD